MAKEWIVPDADLGCDGAYFDYQELVRCRECKYYFGYSCGECKMFNARLAAYQQDIKWNDEFYCAFGKRKDGAE